MNPTAIFRSEKRKAFVRTLPCCVPDCWRKSEPAHIGPHGMNQKAPDDRLAPLCRMHHDELHGPGGRRAFETKYGISLLEIADRIARKPEIKIEGGYFVGRIEGREYTLGKASIGPRQAFRNMIQHRREELQSSC